MLRANPPPPFSMLYKKEANSRDRKFNIEKGGGGSIVEIRKEICLKYSKMTKCLNTFVAHCSLSFQKIAVEFGFHTKHTRFFVIFKVKGIGLI